MLCGSSRVQDSWLAPRRFQLLDRSRERFGYIRRATWRFRHHASSRLLTLCCSSEAVMVDAIPMSVAAIFINLPTAGLAPKSRAALGVCRWAGVWTHAGRPLLGRPRRHSRMAVSSAHCASAHDNVCARLAPRVVADVGSMYAALLGIEVSPHGCRRTSAKLALKGAARANGAQPKQPHHVPNSWNGPGSWGVPIAQAWTPEPSSVASCADCSWETTSPRSLEENVPLRFHRPARRLNE
jgi:hypothetical protein